MPEVVESALLFALSTEDGHLIGTFPQREDAEFTRTLWEEYGRYMNMTVTEFLISGHAQVVMVDGG